MLSEFVPILRSGEVNFKGAMNVSPAYEIVYVFCMMQNTRNLLFVG